VEDFKRLKNELQNLIRSDESQREANLIKATQSFLRRISEAGSAFKSEKSERAEEERALIRFAGENGLWVDEKMLGIYITEGAEQKVYYSGDGDHVVKVADAIFYTTWLDYFNNLLLHNFFFPTTSYSLTGFLLRNEKLCVVLRQKLIVSGEKTDLNNVAELLIGNGFLHKKNNDYFHPQLGIIVEDLHDENVLTNNGALFFIDTVFYIQPFFYQL
jgi:Serine/Threonine/Tyrosine Kinase found in polyvalent proteins